MKTALSSLCFILIALSSCSRQTTGNSNPEEYILHELSEKRIVMLGDFAHEFPLPYQTLSAVLSAWLTKVNTGESDQHHLTLFLEDDQKVADLLRHYLQSGDAGPLLDFILPNTSLERLEFYSDLRRLMQRIDSINARVPASKQIIFDIQGPEALNVFDPKVLDMTDKEASRFFVNVRDSLAAANVIGYFKAHPEQKGLIFYGNGHLIKNIVTKPFAESLTPEERTGAFMAYYLKREYGGDNVLTINQVERGEMPPELRSFTEDVVLPANEVPWKELSSKNEDLDPANFDAFIIRTEVRIPSHMLSHIFSTRIVSAALGRMEFLEPHLSGGKDNFVPHLSGTFAQRYYNQALRTLEFLCDTTFTNSAGWRSWCVAHPCPDLDRLCSGVFRKMFAEKGYQHHQVPAYLDDLKNLGFDQRTANPVTMTRDEWNILFENMWPQAIFLNAIGMALVGEPDERVKAMNYLAQSSGERYEDPSLYMKWWRKKYFGATY